MDDNPPERRKTLMEFLNGISPFIYSSQRADKHLGIFFPQRCPLSYRCLEPREALPEVIACTVSFYIRRELLQYGGLTMCLVKKLICLKGKYNERNAHSLCMRIVSQKHRIPHPTHMNTMTQEYSAVYSVAFHQTMPLLATGSEYGTAKLWRFSRDNSSATCVATLNGHDRDVLSVAFHPTELLLATGSDDGTAKLWRLLSDCSSTTCVVTLSTTVKEFDPRYGITSIAFDPTGSFLATGSKNGYLRFWLINIAKSSATCVATLGDIFEQVTSVAFHPTAPLLATARGNTAMLWLINPDKSATCVATLAGHDRDVLSVAFHPTAPLLATGSEDGTTKLWRLSSDGSSATCVATLVGHSEDVSSVAFHPTAPLLATGSWDSTVRLWLLSSDNSSATCVATLAGHSNRVFSVAFDPKEPFLAITDDSGNILILSV